MHDVETSCTGTLVLILNYVSDFKYTIQLHLGFVSVAAAVVCTEKELNSEEVVYQAEAWLK